MAVLDAHKEMIGIEACRHGDRISIRGMKPAFRELGKVFRTHAPDMEVACFLAGFFLEETETAPATPEDFEGPHPASPLN